MIEIYLLQQLCTFADAGTLSQASEQLHISQPALTRSMQKIEDNLGVPLFERKRNRIYLNETGKLAAKLAKDLLHNAENFEQQIIDFDRRQKTISLVSCAPVPAYEFNTRLQMLYTSMRISTQVTSEDHIVESLKQGRCDLIVTHKKVTDPDLFSLVCGHETLMLSVPTDHPLAKKESVTFKDLDNLPILQFSEVGFWYDLVKRKISHPRLLLQENMVVFSDIRANSSLPTFYTDYWKPDDNRVILPIDDPDVAVTYHIACLKKNANKFRMLWTHMPDTIESHRNQSSMTTPFA